MGTTRNAPLLALLAVAVLGGGLLATNYVATPAAGPVAAPAPGTADAGAGVTGATAAGAAPGGGRSLRSGDARGSDA
ncbi:MAG: hypothetical protein L0I24_10085 [Pseudonocardia sp.]|nr:hypothetical protein [Pseudonocardia sp.]